ncbi:hypothetical protein [Candidatus Nephthysia bennettiae]|uniref:Uncharacterized protein n=1 Tax=Candidatus Nephthysia bennettiae TaxID=3127016 RepID=A0A934K5X4_9BACT|nr:hypothetical protein [Candidatus Dormibacteraeota bacterium]MBJ7612388.1 hypothetical protein [Candidatus Dormibacteraeota bacterium]
MSTGSPQPRYRVVSPEGRVVVRSRPARKPLESLAGKTICEVWDHLYKGDLVFAALRQRLRELYPGVRVVEHPAFGNVHGPDAARVIGRLPDLLREHRCDAVITAVGA